MNKLSKNKLVLTSKFLWGSILFVVVVIIVGIRVYFSSPLPKYEGNQKIPVLRDTVEVYTDSYGAPHVFARNESDLFFTAGYLVARERLFQMSMIASAARGELAKFLGDNLVSRDIYLRTWGIPAVARKIAAELDSTSLKILKDYCAGINYYVDIISADPPVEFKILGVKPLKWTPADVIGYIRLMAHDLQQSWKVEIVMGAMVEKLGREKVDQLFPLDVDTVTIVPPNAELGLLLPTMVEQENALRSLMKMEGTVMGSNNWVISGSRTTTGKPILANDPHLGLSQPAKWFEMHLKGGSYNISGVCLPGIPIPVIGQNDSCAWGFTNVMVDDIDFFIETVRSDAPNQYLHGGKWEKMATRIETIPLKSGGDTTVVVRLTNHGPVISDIHPLLKLTNKVVSMSWVGHRVTREIPGLLNLAKIRNWNDFTNALNDFWIPGQNIIYADVKGNIGWRPAVRVPIRKNGRSLLPRPGADPAYDWQGFVPYNKMPYLFNPPEGFIATANNKTIDDAFPYYISNQWAPPNRIERIRELIRGIDRISVEDVKRMQLDQLSTRARELTPYFLSTQKGDEEGTLKQVFELLENWDFIESPESGATLLFNVAYNYLLKNIYGDELDSVAPGALTAFVAQPMVPSRSLLAMIRQGESVWFDDINTPEKELMNDILYRSMKDAVKDLEQRSGTDINQWAWGDVHTLTFNHVLGKKKILNLLFGFNVGPFKTGGSDGTVNKGEYALLRDYDQIVGPSMRRIVDFSDLDKTQFIIPTGQSGLPASPHYRDQAELYYNGMYRTTHSDEEIIRNSNEFSHLTILPGE
ncbi:MAG: penicillin acylase family protein [Fidelibacterota bacterium]